VEYAGLIMRCAPGTHEAVEKMLDIHDVPRGSALDLAAGSGALLARLRDRGHVALEAVELEAQGWRLDGIPLKSIDLNSDFASVFDKRFDLVTATEIIEHLDAPRHFLRQIAQLLRPGGHLIVSTPNIAHWFGRIRFLLDGEHRYFQRSDYDEVRHITPISHLHMGLMLGEAGFTVIGHRTAGSFYGPVKRIVTGPVALASRVLRGNTTGDSNIYLAQLVTS